MARQATTTTSNKGKKRETRTKKGLGRVMSIRLRKDHYTEIDAIADRTGAAFVEVLRRLIDAGLKNEVRAKQ